MIIPKEEAQKCLGLAREVHGEDPWIDLHVSPFEVIFNSFRYSPDPNLEGVVRIDDSGYEPPVVGPLRVQDENENRDGARRPGGTERMSLFLYRRAFGHIGPRVLGDQMALSGIDKCLLLPVIQPQSNGQEEMAFVVGLYGEDARFSLGYCVPNSVENDRILGDIQTAVRKYGIKAIKLNANITGIDLSTAAGKGRVEAVLDACRQTRLPLIMHGGGSTVVKDPAAKDYASLRNLAEIDWGITREPVVISHGGMMGAASIEIKDEILPQVKRILASHPHTMIDIAALDIPALCLLLRNIEADQIAFGSDCQYFSQWGTIVKLFRALMMSSDRVEDRFLKIVALNPARCLSRGK